MCDSCKISSIADARQFILAGNAYFTLKSAKTGTRYTFRVRKAEDQDRWFVSSLYGSNNESDYSYMGMIYNNAFSLTKKSNYTVDSPQYKAFNWVWQHIVREIAFPNTLEFWHEGRCGRCGRKLTVPESVETGIGPDCAKIMGIAYGLQKEAA